MLRPSLLRVLTISACAWALAPGVANSADEPVLTLLTPADGATLPSAAPEFTGVSNVPGTVTVEVYAGAKATGVPVETLTATGDLSWSATSPSLPDGRYTAQALQDRLSSNPHTFVLDANAPAVSLATGAGVVTNDNTPSFAGTAGTGLGDAPSVTLKIHRGPSADGPLTQALSGPVDQSTRAWLLDPAPLADATYTAQAEQSDPFRVGFSPGLTFTVDTVAPDTTLVDSPAISTATRSARFAFVSNDPGAGFECALDAGAFAPCASPKTYLGLQGGAHTFRVRARDAAGNVDALPESVQFRLGWPMMSPFPIVRIVGTLVRDGVRVRLLSVQAARSSRISISCRGRSCPARRQVITVGRVAPRRPLGHAASLVMLRRFQRHLRAGVLLVIRVTQPNRIGKYTSLLIRRGKLPKRTDRCLQPGRSRPVACMR